MDETGSSQPLSRDQMLAYQHLPSTAEAKERLERVVAQCPVEKRGESKFIPIHEAHLVHCEARDSCVPSLPAGCWCFGLGSDTLKPEIVRVQLEDGRSPIIGSKFCDCSVGQALRASCRAAFRGEETIRLWDAADVPLRFQEFRLDNSPLNNTMPDVIKRMVDECFHSFFLWGAYGTGKTGLAVGLAWAAVAGRNAVLFRSVPDLLSELRSTYGRSDGPTEYEVIKQYATVDVLILDDMGAEQVKNSGWVGDRLYQIIGRRHGAELTTYFTSNLSPKELGDKIGDRIVWRIVEMCGPDNIIEVTGPNLRDVRHG